MTRALLPPTSCTRCQSTTALASRPPRLRKPQELGFSLLEVIIATAVLAGSSMILISLIGLGTKFGSNAEQRSLALCAAQTVLEEFVATGSDDSSAAEITGVIGGRWEMSYRLTVSSLAADRSQSGPSSVVGLQRLTVEVFESELHLSQDTARPLCSVSRLVRRSEYSQGETRGEGGAQ